jgi:membrane-associated protein
MEIIKKIIDIFLHLDKNLAIIVTQYGTISYVLIFLIIFMETGFVVTPFLPGDSLLFAAGAISASYDLNIYLLYLLACIAAILGDTANYWFGHFLGPKVFQKESKFFKMEHLKKAQSFYDKYGGYAIILARFVPIVRTFAPFVAGIAKMSYTHFIAYNIIGGILWVSLFTWLGFFFGNLPFVKANFHYVVLVIILISVAPMVLEFYKARFRSAKNS